MNSFTQYVWGIYFVAALGLITMLWYSLRRARSAVIQDVPVVIAIAVLLTPSSAIPGSSSLAPALVVLIIEGLFDSELSGWRGGVPILLVAVSLLILVFAKYWVVARYFTGAGGSTALAAANGASAVPEVTASKATTPGATDAAKAEANRPQPIKPETFAPDVPAAEPPDPEPVPPEPIAPEPGQPKPDASAPGNGSPSNTN